MLFRVLIELLLITYEPPSRAYFDTRTWVHRVSGFVLDGSWGLGSTRGTQLR